MLGPILGVQGADLVGHGLVVGGRRRESAVTELQVSRKVLEVRHVRVVLVPESDERDGHAELQSWVLHGCGHIFLTYLPHFRKLRGRGWLGVGQNLFVAQWQYLIQLLSKDARPAHRGVADFLSINP